MPPRYFYQYLLHLIVLVALLLAAPSRGLRRLGDRNKTAFSARTGALKVAVEVAREQLEDVGQDANAHRLAIVLLVTDLDRKDRDRLAMLQACIQLCAANLFPTTPSSVYIFTHQPQVELLRRRLGKWLLPNVAVLSTDRSSWAVPRIAADRALWHSRMSADYRIMGDWRLSYMTEFVRAMGHRYLLQLDDDSYILSPVQHNLVDLFDRKKYLLGARQVKQDSPHVSWGLPELTRYFLLTHKIIPATLFEYCDPPNIDGLFSQYDAGELSELPPAHLDALSKLQGPSGRRGWNRTILYGNFVMFSLEWWFRPEVHRFVQLCRATGGAFAYRWNEQGVIAMLWQIFVPRDQFHLFRFHYAHRTLPKEVLEQVPELRLGSVADALGGGRAV